MDKAKDNRLDVANYAPSAKPWAQKVNDWLDVLDDMSVNDITALDAARTFYKMSNGI